MEYKEELTITRSKWDRGNRSGFLYNSGNDCRCILGFYLEKHGASLEKMDTYTQPCDFFSDDKTIETPIPLETKKHRNTKWTIKTIFLNDYSFYGNEERERLLTKHFAQKGCLVKFID